MRDGRRRRVERRVHVCLSLKLQLRGGGHTLTDKSCYGLTKGDISLYAREMAWPENNPAAALPAEDGSLHLPHGARAPHPQRDGVCEGASSVLRTHTREAA